MEMEELDKFFDYDTILQRMLDNVSNNVDKREGSIIYDAVAPCAAELAQMYIELKNDIDLVFMDTAVEQYLDRLANQIGIVRKEATKAIKSGSFYDENDTLMDIELNSRFTNGDYYWVVKEKISTGIYKMECENPGANANGCTGTLLPVDYIEELTKAELGEMLIPGEDTESDEELRTRCFDSINEKAFSGNIADYNKKTKEISGVGAVKVTPVWNGGGTVKLTILDSVFNKASETLINLVQETICPNKENTGIGIAPIRTLSYCKYC